MGRKEKPYIIKPIKEGYRDDFPPVDTSNMDHAARMAWVEHGWLCVRPQDDRLTELERFTIRMIGNRLFARWKNA